VKLISLFMRGNLAVSSHRRVGKADPALRPGKRACSLSLEKVGS